MLYQVCPKANRKGQLRKNTFRSTNSNDRVGLITVSTQEDRLVAEARIEAMRWKDSSRVVGLE